MKTFRMLVILLVLGGVFSKDLAAQKHFSEYFRPIRVKDSLSFSMNSPQGLRADTISYSVFTANVPPSLLQNIDYLMDAEGTTVVGLGRFSLNETFDAYLLGFSLYWFGGQALLVVQKKSNLPAALIPVSNFYGGDGGQVLRNTWFFDYDKDGKKDLLIRDSAHAFRINEEGKEEESYKEYVSLYLWESNGFKPTPIKNEQLLIQKFPVNWDW